MLSSSRFFTVRRLAFGAVLTCLAAGPASAQEAGAGAAPDWLKSRVEGLEKRLAFFGGSEERPATGQYAQPAQSSMADVAVRLDRIENQMRQLNGRLDEMQFQVRRNDEALKRFQGDVDFRIQDLESGKGGGASPKPMRRGDAEPAGASPTGGTRVGDSGLGAPSSGAGSSRGGGDAIGGLIDDRGPGDDPNAPMSIRPPGLSGGASRSTAGVDNGGGGYGAGDRMAAREPDSGMMAGSGGPNDQFALGVGFVQRRDYGQAEATFRDFLRSYPGDPKASEARYWLGESLYQRKKYPDAVETFLAIYRDAPQSPKAPESMLKLGMALNGMGEKDQACATLEAAGKKYTRIKAQSDRELKRISC